MRLTGGQGGSGGRGQGEVRMSGRRQDVGDQDAGQQAGWEDTFVLAPPSMPGCFHQPLVHMQPLTYSTARAAVAAAAHPCRWAIR